MPPRTMIVFAATASYHQVAPFQIHGWTRRSKTCTTHKDYFSQILTPTPTQRIHALQLDVANRENDDYDDFYDDFDPSDYEMYDQNSSPAYHQDEYTRDTDAENTDVDVEVITNLIARRAEMRQERRFEQADQIRDELFESFGVLVRDHDRKWRAGCSGDEDFSDWLRRSSNGSAKKNGKTFGPNGHDYTYATDAGPVLATIEEDEIHKLLAELLACKLSRDFKAADAIQVELLSAGVLVDAKARKWRADGKPLSNFLPNEYNMYPHNYDITDDIDEIERCIRERAQARAERLFKRSDEIRDELQQKFDVRINDKMLLWTVGPERNWGKEYRPYTRSKRSQTPNDIEEIKELIRERDIAREARDFLKADEIRDILLEKNIVVDDRKRTWHMNKTPSKQKKKKFGRK